MLFWFLRGILFHVLEILRAVLLLLLFRGQFCCLFFFLFGGFIVVTFEIIDSRTNNLPAINSTALPSTPSTQPPHHPMISTSHWFLYKYPTINRYYLLNIVFLRYDFLWHKLQDWKGLSRFLIRGQLGLFYSFFGRGLEKGCLVVFLTGKLIGLTIMKNSLFDNTYWFAFIFLSFNIIEKHSSHRKFIIKFSSWSFRPQYSSPSINFLFTACPVNFKSLVLILKITCL